MLTVNVCKRWQKEADRIQAFVHQVSAVWTEADC